MMTKMKPFVNVTLVSLFLVILSLTIHADGNTHDDTSYGTADAFDGHIKSSLDLNFRYRFEAVDEDGLSNAKASTLRSRATVNTQWYSGFDSIIQFDDISVIGWDDYNAGQGENTDRAKILDPAGTEVNQAYIRYQNEYLKTAYGRQRINIGNQRFVGGHAWRQNEQTFDSFTLAPKLSDNLGFNYAYIFNVNTIFGDSVDAGDSKHDTHLLSFDYKYNKNKFLIYYFSIDDEAVAKLSSNTFGIRYSGKLDGFVYKAEYASQSNAGDNPYTYSADYYLLESAYKQKQYSIGLGLEVLGGDANGGQGFTTSLGTLHDFQGWANVFLETPIQGVSDAYIKAKFKVGSVCFKTVYHDFSTDEGNISLGSEIDFVMIKTINKKTMLFLKLADFSSDNDITHSKAKASLMVSYDLH